jgi:hypothetical protein
MKIWLIIVCLGNPEALIRFRRCKLFKPCRDYVPVNMLFILM